MIVLKRIQDNESPFAPVYSPTIAEFKSVLGADLGDDRMVPMTRASNVRRLDLVVDM
eukprot:COSAG02_NODE_6259_length_3697_cov_2.145914_4_plen_57_part_00